MLVSLIPFSASTESLRFTTEDLIDELFIPFAAALPQARLGLLREWAWKTGFPHSVNALKPRHSYIIVNRGVM